MTSMPAAIVVAGADAHEIAIREASRMKVPVIAIANTSANPSMITHIIPAGDNAVSSIQFIFAKLSEGIKQGQSDRAL